MNLVKSIREYGPEHYQKTVDWLNQKDIQDMFGITYAVTLDSHQKWLLSCPQVEILPLYFNEEYIGNIVLTHNLRHKTAYLQIYIGDSQFRGKGLGEEFMKLCLDRCFKNQTIHRLWLHVREYNEIAIKLYSKLGFQTEGIERESVLVNQKFLNQIRMSILQKDWVSK